MREFYGNNMPYLLLTGGKQKIHVSQKLADKIIGWKEDKLISRDHLIDTGQDEYISLGMIKGITKDTDEYFQEETEKKKQERYNYILEWEANVRRYRQQNPEEKANRMLDTGCFLLFKARGNKGKLREINYDKLMISLIESFEKNTDEWWAGREIHQHFIPYGKVLKSKVKGFKSIGELMAKA